MASPHSTFTELVTTTFRNHGTEFADQISQNNILYARMMANGNKIMEDGGLSLVEPLEYAENSTYQRYSGYDRLNIQASEVFTAADFAWKQVALNVVASGLELRTNSGRNQIINLAKSRIKNAVRTFKNNMSEDMYSDGGLSNQINGLQALVSDAGTGTVGGIDSSVYTFWKNKVQSAASPLQGGGSITPSATTIESLMLPLWLALTRGDDQPDLIVADTVYFTYFESSQTSLKRYSSDVGGSQRGKAGFVTLMYKKAEVVYDGGSGIPASHMYFLNTDYIKMHVHKAANLDVLDQMRPLDQDAAVIPILWMGNMTISNRSLQGVMKA
jgi:hypothetical protein